MAHGDYCPRCRTMHDILRDCPPIVEPGMPVAGSISRDLLDAQAEIRRLNLQNNGLQERLDGVCAEIQRLVTGLKAHFDERRSKGLCEGFLTSAVDTALFHLKREVAEKDSLLRLNGEYKAALEKIAAFGCMKCKGWDCPSCVAKKALAGKPKCVCGGVGLGVACERGCPNFTEKRLNEVCWCAAKAETKDAVCPIHG